MQITEFKSIVTTFADPGSELLFDNKDFMISFNGDVITAKITTRSGDVYIDDGSGSEEPASIWILKRLAHLPLLAQRLRDTIPATEHFISPVVSLLPTLERDGDEHIVKSNDGLNSALETLNQRSPLETMVLYITSDAGEGKTSLINQLARKQAQCYIEKQADWLLVPIPLGGRHFLRFDDITVGVMQNRYRFPFLYYQSFLALVQMGVIVPAFDGFEEMFVESSSGEALSAMGILLSSLDSRGAMVVAARKAYFDFENLRTQERLFDTIKSYSVGFGKLELCRWAKPQFIAYCNNREVENPEELYLRVSERLTPQHALLTRAVLIKRLVDVIKNSPSINDFLGQLQKSGADFFSVFVRRLIEREANEKWLDRSGEKEVGAPLLTTDEHCELLSQIALLMWESKINYLKLDALEFAADYFCEVAQKNAFQAQQIRTRIRGHAMLISATNLTNAIEFDHDEFRLYFLGEGIASQIRPMNNRAKSEIFGIFRRGPIPDDAMMALFRSLTRDQALDRARAITFLLEVAGMDTQASYTNENVSEMVIRLLNGFNNSDFNITNLSFGYDALRDKNISKVTFQNCYFSTTSLECAELNDCVFIECKFSQLGLTENYRISRVTFKDCIVDALVPAVPSSVVRNPTEVREQLKNTGITFLEDMPPSEFPSFRESDLEITDLEKLIRYFMRSTHMSESIILLKLGARGKVFIDDALPKLIKQGVIEEIDNRGGGVQRRFRLSTSVHDISAAITSAEGSFERFLERVGQVS